MLFVGLAHAQVYEIDRAIKLFRTLQLEALESRKNGEPIAQEADMLIAYLSDSVSDSRAAV